MNINTLQVMNSLYNLGLTEAEFKAITDEISHTERTGFSIKAIKGDKVVGVSHDDKESIIINDLDEFGKFDLKPNTRILLKTLVQLEDLPERIYDLHRICKYRSMDIEIKNVANSLDELKLKICERFSDKYDKVLLADDGYWQEHSGYDLEKREKAKKTRKEKIIEQLKAVYWLFNEPFDFEFKETPKNIAVIRKVFSEKNIRVAIIQEIEEFEKRCGAFYDSRLETCEGIKVRVRTFKPSDKRYDYVCEGREIYSDEYGEKELWITDELKSRLSDKELAFLVKRIERSHYRILTKELYEMEKDSLRVEIMTARRKSIEQKNQNTLVSEIKKQFKEGSLVRQGITITPDSFSYEEIKISGTKMQDFIAFENIPVRTNLDFQNLVISYIEYLVEKSREFDYFGNGLQNINFKGKADVGIGNISIHIERIRAKNQEYGGVFYINKIRVRTEEVCEIIAGALRFHSQNDYDAWLKDVSLESLRLKNAIKNGITFKFPISKSDDNSLIDSRGEFNFTLPLKKTNKKVYVSFGDKEYKVQDINSLFELQKKVDENRIGNETLLGRAIKLLYKGIKDISPIEIGKLITISQKEHKEKIERGKKFLAHAVRIANAERVQKGWIVKGESGQEYLVEDSLSVHRLKNREKDSYLCIMDTETYGENDEAQQNDRLAKRILAMKHDISVAKDMWQLGDKVDKWWRDIQKEEFQEQIKQELISSPSGMQEMSSRVL